MPKIPLVDKISDIRFPSSINAWDSSGAETNHEHESHHELGKSCKNTNNQANTRLEEVALLALLIR